MNITYNEIEPYLLDYAQNIEVPEEINYRIKAYLQKNPDFQKELDELKETADFLDDMPLVAPSPQLSIGFYAMLAQEQAKTQTIASRPKAETSTPTMAKLPTAMRKWTTAVGIACMLLVGFGISWQILNNNGEMKEQMAMETKPSLKKAKETSATQTEEVAQTTEKSSESKNPNIENVSKKQENLANINPITQGKGNINDYNAGIAPEQHGIRSQNKVKGERLTSEEMQNVTIHNRQITKKNIARMRNTQEDAFMQEGVSGSFSTYNNKNVVAMSGEVMNMETKNTYIVKQPSTSEKLTRINEAQATSGELLQLLEKDQNIHVKLWAIQALDQQMTNQNTQQNKDGNAKNISQKVAELLPTYSQIALQMATLDWIAKYKPTNKKQIIESFLKNNNLPNNTIQQAEKLK